MRPKSHWLRTLVGALALPAALGVMAEAQYFGRNKIQYEDFDFKVLESPHFELYFYPPTGQSAQLGIRMLERWYHRFSSLFEYQFVSKNPVILYANLADFQQTNILPGLIGQATGGATEGIKRRVVMPVSGSLEDLNHVLGHELVHVFQFALAAGSVGQGQGAPLWFIEGMPEYLTLGRVSPQTAIRLRDALLYDRLPDIAALSLGADYFPYRWGHALWAYMGSRFGDETVNLLFRRVLQQDWREALEDVLGVPQDQLAKDWQQAIRQAYNGIVAQRVAPDKIGRMLELRGDLNVAPVLSPDGRTLALLSQRDIFTVDLYLYDTVEGKILRKLSDFRRDAHFEALRFIDTAGAWSPNGSRFAFVAFARGDNRIVIVEAGNGNVVQQLDFPDLGAVMNPAYAPDGRRLAFIGSRGGILDLYTVDLATRERRQLTQGLTSELQPQWSPDGRTIALVTDRGPGTDLDQLAFGKTNIALVNAETGDTQVLLLFSDTNHTNPVFSPDGRSLYFVADREGIPDIFRYEFPTAEIYQITRIATGVTGITGTSPSMSVASRQGNLAFSVFQKSGLRIILLESGEAAGVPAGASTLPINAALLPGATLPPGGIVETYLTHPAQGLPVQMETSLHDYRPQLQLSYLGSTVSTSLASQFENNLAGGISAQFSDLLENNILGLGFFLSGDVDTFGGQAAYINQSGFLNWGVNLSRVPYLSYRRSVELLAPDGSSFRDRLEEQITTLNSGEASLFIPFSQVLRLEVGAGFSYYQFDRSIQEVVVENGEIVSRSDFDAPAPGDLSLATIPVALVKDSSYFGLASPVRGERYRLSLRPQLGSLILYDVLADYRRYFFNIGFTVALRALHAGHYGPDAENDQVSQYFVGSSYLVRGYEGYTLDIDRRGNSNALENLLGSRLAIVNLEFRVPVLGIRDYGLVNFPYFPLEIAAFLDSGTAWSNNNAPQFGFRDISQARVPVLSAGLASRLNLGGVLVFELYYAYPFQNRGDRGHFGFQIGPGW